MADSKRHTGKVIWFSSKTGFGFIAPDDGGKDIFTHFKHIQMEGFKTLRQGQIVEYEIGENDKGPIATNVKVIKDAPAE